MRHALLLALVAVAACDRKDRTPPPPDQPIAEDTMSDGNPCALSDDVCWDSVMRHQQDSAVADTGSVSLQPAPSSAAARAAPPTISNISFRETPYKSDTSRYWIRYSLNKAPAARDSVRVRFQRSAGSDFPSETVTRWRTKQRDSVLFTTPRIYDKRVAYRAGVLVRRNGANGPEVFRSWVTNWVDTVPPVPDTVVVDSSLAVIGIEVKPDSVKMTIDTVPPIVPQQQQFCAFIRFADGKIAQRSKEKGLPYCDGVYPLFPLATRSVSAKQQAVADKVCVKWSAEGGTITADICDPVPSTGVPS